MKSIGQFIDVIIKFEINDSRRSQVNKNVWLNSFENIVWNACVWKIEKNFILIIFNFICKVNRLIYGKTKIFIVICILYNSSKVLTFSKIKRIFLSIICPRDISYRWFIVTRLSYDTVSKFLVHSSLDPPEPSIADCALARTTLHKREEQR